MAMKWTREQQNVIEYRNRNILVSAAAGSGKTAVLVERIIQRITDKENPTDIDRILVVTFTKAAAAEMRERIGNAISKCREEYPEDRNLERQMTLLHNAQITTIDSFCLFLVRNHFGDINLEPNFRVADPGEVKLIEIDVLAEIFEKNYAREGNQEFIQLVDAYSGKRNDQAVRDMVSKLYHMSSSDSWPREWLAGLNKIYQVRSEEELLETDLMKGIVLYVVTMIREAKQRIENLEERAIRVEGLEKYVQTIQKDKCCFDKIEEICDYKGVKNFFDELSLGNMSAIRNFTGDEQQKEAIKNERNLIKEDLKKIKETYFKNDLEELIEQLHRQEPYTRELIRLSIEYFDAMADAKTEKRIADFSDIEHFALKILVDEQTKEIRSTAIEFRKQFDEIMIDEYQDSNQVQEDIMCAISREMDGEPNMFMVGDVKQSIYRFRLARPELFMYKYQTYSTEEGEHQRIDLHKNFRSRQEVVEFTNDIFYKIMQSDLGKVAYDEDVALNCGAVYPEGEGMEAEVLLFDQQDELLTDILEDEEENSKRIEARMVAHRIQRLKEEGKVTDKQTGELRTVRYSDIVILFRSLKDWGTEFASVFADCGIPAYVESSTGYFKAYEVQVVLNFLRILDNPYQDIPMAAILRAPFVGLDAEELAEIRSKMGELSFSEAAIKQMKEGETEKLAAFGKMFRLLREKVCDTSIHELIQNIFDVTGFADYVALMPGGLRRAQNLEMLLEKAITFEKTSYKGLFHFVRYIDQLEKYEVDFGEADVIGENEDVVRIMTIHKSKGLEFPIVFVSGIGKKLNMRDTNEALVVHPEMGLGLYEMGTKPRTKKSSLLRNEIAETLRKENLGEELRVLYVALTRAKEKLILSGLIKNQAKTMEKYVGNVFKNVPISFTQRVKATTYMDWLIPALLSYPEKYQIMCIESKELAMPMISEYVQQDMERACVEQRISVASEELWVKLNEKFNYVYPYERELDRKSKYSVSELKHDSMVQQYDQQVGEGEIPDFLHEECEAYIPIFAREFVEKKETDDANREKLYVGSQGALRGTAMHRVMECWDFGTIIDVYEKDESEIKLYVKQHLRGMLEQNLISEEMYALVQIPALVAFIKSKVGLRMAEAQIRGELYREKPFVMDYDGVLVQGIIDVFWRENDKIVLLDYKTDRVNTKDELILRYKKQMELYGEALEKIFSTEEKKIKVTERIIYSFRLKEEIKV